MYYRGIMLAQKKEPALSRSLQVFIDAQEMNDILEIPDVEEPEATTYDQLIETSRLAQIIDERDGKLLADKLEEIKGKYIKDVVVDAMDDEPYVSSQLNPVLQNQQLASKGMELFQSITKAENAYFLIYKNLTDLESRIPRRIGGFAVKRMRGRYPAESRVEDIRQNEERLVIGAGALIHFARAVYYKKPQTTAFVTVAGDCIEKPMNLEVSIGMTVTQVLERCGLRETPHRIVVGGSMTGQCVQDTDEETITATSRAVLAFRQDLLHLGLNCIGCGRCIHVCPEGLNPFLLYRSIQQNAVAQYATLKGDQCTHCGTCSYVCPAKLDLSEIIYTSSQQSASRIAAYQLQKENMISYDKAKYLQYLADHQLGRSIQQYQEEQNKLLDGFGLQKTQLIDQYQRLCKKLDGEIETSRLEMEKNKSGAKKDYEATLSAHATLERTLKTAIQDAEKRRDETYEQSDKALIYSQKQFDQTDDLALEIQGILVEELERHAQIQNSNQEQSNEIKQMFKQRASTFVADCKQLKDQCFMEIKNRCKIRTKRFEDTLTEIEQDSALQLKASKEHTEKAKETMSDTLHSAEKAFEEVQARCVREKKEAEARLNRDIRELADQTMLIGEEKDAWLRVKRDEAMEASMNYGSAQAVLMGRAPQKSDFIVPAKLEACEEALHSSCSRMIATLSLEASMLKEIITQEYIQSLVETWSSKMCQHENAAWKEATPST